MKAQDPFNTLATKMTTDYNNFYNQGGMKFDPSKVQTDPGYAFREKQGMNALQNSAMARGGMMSGNTIKAAQDYGQNLASQEYGNAYNRSFNEYSNELSNMSKVFDWSQGQVDKFQGMKMQDPRIQQMYQQADEKAAKENVRIAQAGGMIKGVARIGAGIMTGGGGLGNMFG